MEHWILAGDVGGTKTAVGLYRPVDLQKRDGSIGDPPAPVVSERYRSRDFNGLAPLVSKFLSENRGLLGDRPIVATFGVAGPVLENRSETTNLPWVIDAGKIESEFGWMKGSVCLVNDLVAMGWGINLVGRSGVHSLRQGRRDPVGNAVLVAPGTGLGEAIILKEGGLLKPIPSEGGHSDWAPVTPLQLSLLEYLWTIFPHVSSERLLSGPGILHLYRFVTRDLPADPLFPPHASEEALPEQITRFALEENNPYARKTLMLFSEILAQEVGNMALKVLATGGVYLGGGIPVKIRPFLEEPGFLKRISEKGRYTEFLDRVPVDILTNEETPLLGAAFEAWTRYAKMKVR
ncbi:MAG: glucokinase [Leptospirales bacterium]